MGKYGEGVDDFSSSPMVNDGKVGDQVHVLVVDDSRVDRKVVECLLENTSCKVTTVDSGRNALQFLGLDEEANTKDFYGVKVDMIITDYCMPEMTGYELLKKIKGSSYYKEVPVVIMSSENILARKERCWEEGAEDFMTKPLKLADVQLLKNYMFGNANGSGKNNVGTCKRELQETYDESSSSYSSSLSPSNSLSSLDSSSTPSSSTTIFSSPSSNATPPSPLSAI